MVDFFKKIQQAVSGKKDVEFKPISMMDRFAQYGIKPLIMTEQTENRIALMSNLRSVLKDVFSGRTLQQQLDAIDRALPLIMIISQAWGRGHKVWTKFSAQFRCLRKMPAFMDTLIEEFMDMLNHGWLPEDVTVAPPIVMITPQAPRQPLDLGEFEKATRPPVEVSTPRQREQE